MCLFNWFRYDSELSTLPNMPEMIFPQNYIRLECLEGGFGIEFNALDALKLVDTSNDPVKVAYASDWKDSR